MGTLFNIELHHFCAVCGKVFIGFLVCHSRKSQNQNIPNSIKSVRMLFVMVKDMALIR